jgi:hypothetical protein
MTNISEPLADIKKCEEASIEASFLMRNGVSPQTIREILHETGYQAYVEETDTGWDITSSSNGTSFVIRLNSYDETKDSYRRISISSEYESYWDIDAVVQKMNEFNQTYCHLKGYVEKDGRLIVKMDFLLGEGVSTAQIVQWLQLWRAGLALFERFWCKAFED